MNRGAHPAGGQAARRLELKAEGGMTLIELLVVMAILVVVIASLTNVFISTIRSETDQTNRVGAQQDARLSLDQMRREIHCASDATLNSSSSVTVTLPTYCKTAPNTTLGAATTIPAATITVGSTQLFNSGANKISFGTSGTVSCTGTTATTFTGCSGGTAATYASGTKVISQVTWCAYGSSAPYSLRRFVGDAALTSSCAGASGVSGRTFASSLTTNALFSYNRSTLVSVNTPTVSTGSALTETLGTGTYAYDVTALLSTGVQVSGAIKYATISSGSNNQVTVTWPAYVPSGGPTVSAYYVYGRDDGSNTSAGLRLLKILTCPCATLSYTDHGPTTLNGNLTVPSSGTYTVTVQSTATFNTGGANTITFGAGSVNCTGTSSTTFTGCSGGTAGSYTSGTTVDSASTAGPPLATLSVALTTDKSPANPSQRFSFSDDIDLRNSGRF